MEAGGNGHVAVLSAGYFDIAVAGELLAHRGEEVASGSVEGFVDAVSEEAGLEAGGPEECLLGDGDALDGEEFLGVFGLIDGDEVVFEAGDLVQLLEADDGEAGSGEAVLAGVLGGASLAFGGARSCGTGGIGAIGGDLLRGDGFGEAYGLFTRAVARLQSEFEAGLR